MINARRRSTKTEDDGVVRREVSKRLITYYGIQSIILRKKGQLHTADNNNRISSYICELVSLVYLHSVFYYAVAVGLSHKTVEFYNM